MPKYSIILTRDVTESTTVEVEADTPDQAEALALETDASSVTWAIDDGNVWPDPYVTGTEEA